MSYEQKTYNKANKFKIKKITSALTPIKFHNIINIVVRAGICSHKNVINWINDKRISVNERLITSSAIKVSKKDIIKIDGKMIQKLKFIKIWKYYKPIGLSTSYTSTENYPTIFPHLRRKGLANIIAINHLNINSEGLLLITNNNSTMYSFKKNTTNWLHRYSIYAYGQITQKQLDTLQNGVLINKIKYKNITALLQYNNNDNNWINVTLKENKNQSIKLILNSFNLKINRLIHLSYGPFKLNNIEKDTIEPIQSQIFQKIINNKKK